MKALLIVLSLALLTPAFAEEASEREQRLIQDVISSQITAFLNNDARAAWVHAHPMIKAQFNTPEKFMAMVARGYSPLLNFTELNFQDLEQVNDQWVQKLSLKDDNGDWYELFYSLMEVQPGRMQITGVYLEALDSI